MRLLILGGTVFLGYHTAEAALARGWDVTLFCRGRSGTVPAGAKVVHGDRGAGPAGLAGLAGGEWDLAIDTSGYVPRLVRAAAEALRGRVKRYVFISSISVYAEFAAAADETAPLANGPTPLGEEIRGDTYGPLKAASEAALADVYGRNALSVRPGLIVGPRDPSDRFTYWVRRLNSGGEALAPGDGSAVVQVIDVRDLAEFLLTAGPGRVSGVVNAAGPSLRLRDVLGACAAAAGSGAARLAWVPEAWLEAQGVAPWTELPLWLPRVEQRVGTARARAAGLQLRPLADTVEATLAWDLTRDQSAPLKAGLAPAREQALLARYAGEAAPGAGLDLGGLIQAKS